MNSSSAPKSVINKIVLVAALGYFVDIYDLVLFGMERISSLHDLLITNYPDKTERDALVASIGSSLLSYQMIGMLVGGIFWGVLGDKKGRLSVLFGSILVYSLANIANGMIQDTFWYAILRFVSGFGLAGELGAGITLVSETMKKEDRGIGTTVVASVGLFGAVVAGFTTIAINNWRMSYYIGGAMGLLLLFLRIGVFESGMFSHVKNDQTIKKGNFFYLFSHPKLLLKYLNIILIAIPVWFVMFFLVQFAPEMSKALGLENGPKEARVSIMIAYIGITIGDVVSGTLSQKIKSRKNVLFYFIAFTLLFSILYYLFAHISIVVFYTLIFCVGFGTGYWAVFMSSASELFGTNIRATVTTTAPNFVRGSVTLMAISHASLKNSVGYINSSIIIGSIVFVLAFIACYKLDETFAKDLNYTE
ncbi:MAG: MFS transporter [Sphingobacteriaceae bacterium]|nr:MFS transporter [Sphingobacteriaceae bacterium]